MIIKCKRCCCLYNNKTSEKCPLCNIEVTDKQVKKERKRQEIVRNIQRKKYGGVLLIDEFIRSDTKNKRTTSSGYRHKTKTGKNGNI